MYRRPRFLELLIVIREEMARDADFDVDLFVEMARSGNGFEKSERHSIAASGANSNHESSEKTLAKKK
jgi:hypothetical protein